MFLHLVLNSNFSADIKKRENEIKFAELKKEGRLDAYMAKKRKKFDSKSKRQMPSTYDHKS